MTSAASGCPVVAREATTATGPATDFEPTGGRQ
jgi:hypothetical protein